MPELLIRHGNEEKPLEDSPSDTGSGLRLDVDAYRLSELVRIGVESQSFTPSSRLLVSISDSVSFISQPLALSKPIAMQYLSLLVARLTQCLLPR